VNQQTYTIKFDNVSDAEANRYASELRDVLLDATADIEVERKRDDPRTQDFGATLIIILGSAAVTALAKSLGDWLTLHRQVGITIKTPAGDFVATNLTSKDALKLAELLHSKE